MAQQVTLPDVGKSGNDYLRSCEALTHNEDFSVQDVQCRIYTQGVVEGLTAYQVQARSKLFDAPPHLNVSQVEKIIVKYMNDHPKNLNITTSQLILWALMDAYPPKK
jgi:hypothetical protein